MMVTQGMAVETCCQLAHAARIQADTRSRLDRARPAAAHDWRFLFMGAGEQEGGKMQEACSMKLTQGRALVRCRRINCDRSQAAADEHDGENQADIRSRRDKPWPVAAHD